MKMEFVGRDSARSSPSQYVHHSFTLVPVYLFIHKAFFNVMLKEFGVQGVKVHEVVSLDDEILLSLPFVFSVRSWIVQALTEQLGDPCMA